jgi:cysteine desulfurase/selenocysteine lyase
MFSRRSQFPIFKAKNFPKSFLDSAASAQKPACVLEAMDKFARTRYANIHRGVHSLAEASTAAYEGARESVAKFIDAPKVESIVFTGGTTASVNLAAFCLTHSFVKRGDTIVTTALEHHSNYLPWQRAVEEGIQLVTLPISLMGELNFSALEERLKMGAKLLAITHASNVLGNVLPLKEITALAHKHGCLVFVDGAQAVPHMPVSVSELDCDFYAFSGHKLYGPTGVGVLYIRSEIAGMLPPFMLGGGMVNRVGENFSETAWAPPPQCFEAGTPPIIEAVGLASAIDFVQKIGFEKIVRREAELTAYALERLKEVPDITIYGQESGLRPSVRSLSHAQNIVKCSLTQGLRRDDSGGKGSASQGEYGAQPQLNPTPSGRGRGVGDVPARIGVISFNLQNLHPHDVGSILSAHGVAVRVGHHCAQPLMKSLGILGCVRASIGMYNDESDIDRLIEGLELARKKLL